jgi:6-phosphogluconolactonase (cycloisomerase 2 family)
MTTLLIGGYSGDKGAGTGITVLDGDLAGGHLVTSTIPADCASWIARHPQLPVLYAVEETPDGHVQAWSLADGTPGELLGRGATGGSEPAHLTVDSSGRFLITANYSGGSISVHELGADGSIGRRTDLVRHERHGEHERQEQAHPHMVRDVGGMLLITDLGGDAIYRYRLDPGGKLMSEGIVTAPPGSGPRHVLPVGDHHFVTAELSGQVLGYDAAGNVLSAVPASEAEGPNQPSELASNGRYLYVANRGPDTVSVFALDRTPQGHPVPRYVTEVQVGAWPRHIALDDDLLYVANERSHEVMVLRIDPATGVPAHAQTIEVPSPTVVLP